MDKDWNNQKVILGGIGMSELGIRLVCIGEIRDYLTPRWHTEYTVVVA